MKREARIVGARAVVCQRGMGLEEALAKGGAAVISFGLCGALDPSLKVGDLVIGDAVFDGLIRYDCDPTWSAALAIGLPTARRGLFYADGEMFSSVERKMELLTATGASAVDMESHLAARLAAQFGVPFAIVRAVSDTALTAIPPVVRDAFKPSGEIDAGAIVKKLISGGLGEMRDLFPLARDSGRAFRALESVASPLFLLRA
jgi:nucleoside phosphorylase